jgi:carboxypeptidase PM20D1
MKKIGLGLILISLITPAIVVWRGLNFVQPPPPVPAAVEVSWDETSAVENLTGALKIATVSVSKDVPPNAQAFAEFHRYLTSRYPLVFTQLEIELVAEHSLLIRWQGENNAQTPIMFLAHQDVVPVTLGSAASWAYPPFAAQVADGFIWGRGALDDKASLIALLESAERLLGEGFSPERTIYFGFGHDEEIGGLGAQSMAALLAQRNVRLGFLLDEGGFVTKGLIPGVEGRVALIGPAEKGYTSLRLTAVGKGGHASMPPKHTALGRVARAISRLEKHPFPADLTYTRDTLKALGEKAPFVQRLIFANLWLFEKLAVSVMSDNPATNAGIRTTTAATMMSAGVKDNVLPQTAEAVVNFRILPGDTVDSVVDFVNTVIDDDQVNVSLYSEFSNDPSNVSPIEGAGYSVLSEIITQIRPDTVVAPRLVVGATDARHYESIADASYRFLALEVGPDELAGMHGTNERVSVASFVDSMKMYYLLMQRAAEL